MDASLRRMTPVPVDPRVTPDQAYHHEYGSPVYPAPGWQWQFNSRIERLIPTILEEPSRHRAPRFATPKCGGCVDGIQMRATTALCARTMMSGKNMTTISTNTTPSGACLNAITRPYRRSRPPNLVIKKSSPNPNHRRVDGSLYGTQTAATLSPAATNPSQMRSTNMTQRRTGSSAYPSMVKGQHANESIPPWIKYCCGFKTRISSRNELTLKLRIRACCALSIILDLLLLRDRLVAAGQGLSTRRL